MLNKNKCKVFVRKLFSPTRVTLINSFEKIRGWRVLIAVLVGAVVGGLVIGEFILGIGNLFFDRPNHPLTVILLVFGMILLVVAFLWLGYFFDRLFKNKPFIVIEPFIVSGFLFLAMIFAYQLMIAPQSNNAKGYGPLFSGFATMFSVVTALYLHDLSSLAHNNEIKQNEEKKEQKKEKPAFRDGLCHMESSVYS